MKVRDNTFFLLNIIEALTDIQEYSAIEKSVFLMEKMRQDAIIRRFEILGEAVKNLEEEFRERHSEINWRGAARFRDILIHQYFGVDLENVWDIAVKEVPTLLLQIKSLPELKRS